MGSQKGPLRIEGNVGNLSFFKTADGHQVRIKAGPSADAMRTDKRFARTRENWAEFANAGKAAKLIRSALAQLVKKIKNRYGYAQLVKQTLRVVKSDPVNPRGQRVIQLGDFANLQAYEFNGQQPLASAFHLPIAAMVDRAAGTLSIDIPGFKPSEAITAPEGATHLRFVAGAADLDWVEENFTASFGESADIPMGNQTEPAVNLAMNLPPASTNTIVLTLGVWFFQEVNGELSRLHNGSTNALAIVAIDHI